MGEVIKSQKKKRSQGGEKRKGGRSEKPNPLELGKSLGGNHCGGPSNQPGLRTQCWLHLEVKVIRPMGMDTPPEGKSRGLRRGIPIDWENGGIWGVQGTRGEAK